MTRYIYLICLVFLQSLASAQSFAPKDTLLIANLSNPVFEWIDVNNDGRLDMFVSGQDLSITTANTSLSYVFEQQADTTFVVQNTNLATFGQQFFRVADLNRDGRQDLLVAATDGTEFEHAIYRNNGDYTWTKVVVNAGESIWQELRLADLDNDGLPEIITASSDGLKVYKEFIGLWQEVTMPQELTSIFTDPVVLDIDKDGFKDLFLAGQLANGDSIAVLLINQKELEFSVQKVESDSLQITDYVVSDFNEDGFPDVLVSRNVDNRSRALSVLRSIDNQRFRDITDPNQLRLKNARVFAADLNSDGKLETDIEGRSPGLFTTVVARERVFNNPGGTVYEQDTLINSSGEGRRYGDYDFDGDLDYFEVTTNALGSRLWLFENTETVQNEGPGGLSDLISFRFMDDLYLVWNRADDDFTSDRSVTYDVAIGTAEGQADVVAGGFDPSELKRTVVGPGNQGHNDFMILKNAPDGPLYTTIMPIDNAFHYDVSQCLGGTGGAPCGEEIPVTQILLCNESDQRLSTENGEVARWFSVDGGYLGTSSFIDLSIVQDDFIIAVYDRVGGCVDGEVFAIKFDAGLTDLPDLQICNGNEVNVNISDQWESIRWVSANQGEVSTTSNLTYTPLRNDLMTLITTTARGCEFENNFSVRVTTLIGEVADSVVQVKEGESVRISARGGDSYLWLPPDGLNNNRVADPLATPTLTTEYTVFIASDAGCLVEKMVLVEVIKTSFAPDVFSPNGDGRNERYLVYDLENVANVTFSIFDRAGNKVFESSNLQEITGRGWDGTKNGTELPAGSYFWRVSGNYLDGQSIKINGGIKGALQLIR